MRHLNLRSGTRTKWPVVAAAAAFIVMLRAAGAFALAYGTMNGVAVNWTSYGASTFSEAAGVLQSNNPNFYSSTFVSDTSYGPSGGNMVVDWEIYCVAAGYDGYAYTSWDFDAATLNTGSCQWCNGGRTGIMVGAWAGTYAQLSSGANATSSTAFPAGACASAYRTYKFVVLASGGSFIFQDGAFFTYSPDNIGTVSNRFVINTQGNAGNYLWRAFTGNTNVAATPLTVTPGAGSFDIPFGSSAAITATVAGNTGAVSWRMDILNAGGTLLRTYTGSGTSISQTWDAKNSSAVDQAAGSYTARIAAWDTSANYHVADTTAAVVAPPTQSAHSPANSSYLTSTSQTVTFTASENSDCKWSLTDDGFDVMASACTGSGTTSQSCAVTGLAEGANTVYFSCNGTIGNRDTAFTNTGISYTVDTQLPTQSAWSPVDASTLTSTSQNVTLSTNENATCKWALADDTYAAMTNTCTGGGSTSHTCAVSGLAQGLNTFSISCSDTAGNGDTSISNTDISYTVDSLTPTQSAWSPASASSIANTSQNITLTTNENATCKWSLTDDTYAAMTNTCAGGGTTGHTCAVAGLVQGANTVSISCADTLGNADSNTSNTDLSYTSDTLVPAQSAWSPASGSTLANTSQNITLTTDENATCKWSLTDDTYAAMTNTCTGGGTTSHACAAAGFAQGANTVSISCVDALGNADTAGTNTDLAYTSDTLSPAQSAHNPATGPTLTSNSPTISFTLNESGTCRWALTDLAYSGMTNACSGAGTMSQSCAVTGLPDGANTVSLSCADAQGNADSNTTNTDLTYNVDTTIPDTTPPTQGAHSPVSGASIASTSPTITLSLNENGTCRWALTDLAYSGMTNACSGAGTTSQSCAVTGLPQGSNTVTIACVDGAGNADTTLTNTSLTYTVDTTPPVQSAHNPADGSVFAATSKTVTLTLNENGTCRWALSDLAYDGMTNTCSGGGTTSQSCAATGLAQGANTLYISCADPTGNKDSATTNTQLAFTVDTTAPAISYVYDGTGADQAYATSATTLSANWSVSSSSGIQKYEYAIGTTSGGTEALAWTNNGTGTSVTKTGLALIDGTTYYISVKAYNNAGTASTGTSNGVKVDASAPGNPVVTDGGITTTEPDKLLFTLSAADAHTGVAKTEYAIGTATGATDVRGWTEVTGTDVTATGLSLTAGTNYYILVRATNGAGLVSEPGVSDGITRVVGANVQFSFLPAGLTAAVSPDSEASVPVEMIYKEVGGATAKYDQLAVSYQFADGTSNGDPVSAVEFSINQSEERHVNDTVVIPAKYVSLALGASASAKVTVKKKYTGVDSAGNTISTTFEIPVTLTNAEASVRFEAGKIAVTSVEGVKDGDAVTITATGKISTKGIGAVQGQWVVDGQSVSKFSFNANKSGDTIVTETMKPLKSGAKVSLRITSPSYKESGSVTYYAPPTASDIADFWAGPFHVTGVKANTDPGATTLTGEGSFTLPMTDIAIKVPFTKLAVEAKDGKNVVSGAAAVTGIDNFKVEKGPLSVSVSAVLLKADGVTADGTITLKGGNGVPGLGPLNFFALKVSDQGFSGKVKFTPPQKGKIGVFAVNIDNMDFSLQQSQVAVKVTGYFLVDQPGLLYVKLPLVIENLPDGGLKFSAP